MREVVSTIPTTKTKYLHVQLEWLCAGQAEGTFTETATYLGNHCPVEQTCRSGACVSSDLDCNVLPSSAPDAGACFDADACFARVSPVTPDQACTVSLPAGGGMVNFGLVTSADGAYGDNPCAIPLVHGQDIGRIEAATRVQFPAGVCSALAAHTIKGVVVASCDTQKTSVNRPCPRAGSGDAGNVVTADDAGNPSDTGATTDAGL